MARDEECLSGSEQRLRARAPVQSAVRVYNKLRIMKSDAGESISIGAGRSDGLSAKFPIEHKEVRE